jgi:aminoglycoside 2'-N-acetyltransferase I
VSSTLTDRLRVEVRAWNGLPGAERRALGAWFREQFSETSWVWAHLPVRVLARVDGEIVGHLGMLRRDIAVGGEPVTIAGVGSVMVRPKWRKRGVAQALLERAARHMREALRVDFGLLVCRDEVAQVYERAGWRIVAGPTCFEQPTGRATYQRLTMMLPLGAATWPDGEIDLRGLPW